MRFLYIVTTLLLQLITGTLTAALSPQIPLQIASHHHSRVSQSCTHRQPNATTLVSRTDGAGLPAVYSTLTTCPQIAALDLKFTWGGCTGPTGPWRFDFRAGDRFPALTNLTLANYDYEGMREWTWKERRWEGSTLYKIQAFVAEALAWPALQPRPLPRPEPSLEQWLRAMDFGQIERLDVDQNGYFFFRMARRLASLKHLSIDGRNLTDANLERFLKTIQPLDSLALSNGRPVTSTDAFLGCSYLPLDVIINRHGATLRSLSLSQAESRIVGERRTACSPADVAFIAAGAPVLEHLTLDVDRNGSWPNATLNALASIRSLTALTLRLELGANLHLGDHHGEYGWNHEGLNGTGPFREPRVNTWVIAEQLFEDLRAKKAGRPLERLEIEVGEIDKEGWSGPLYFPPWDEGRARQWVCERGKEQCRILGDVDPWDDA